MKASLIFMVVAFASTAFANKLQLRPDEDREVALPSFAEVTCPSSVTADVCIEVIFSSTDSDMLHLTEDCDEPTILMGYMASNMAMRAVVILADEDSPDDTIVMNSPKVPGCKKFTTQLHSSAPVVTCLNNPPHPENENDDAVEGREASPLDRSDFQQTMFPRGLDAGGYKLTVVVYYDDLFKEQFKANSVKRVKAIMAIVDEMYSEKDTLKTEIQVVTKAIEHKSGQNWGTGSWGPMMKGIGEQAVASPHDANLYVFLTGKKSKDGLGLARLNSVCNPTRNNRISMNKYAAGSVKGGDAYTAETIAHEMGHNLGLWHDCINFNCAYWHPSYKGPRKGSDGKDCFGYMDYKDETQGWSMCTVDDFKKYINSLSSFCLPPLNGDTGPTTPAASTDVMLTTKIWASEISWSLGTGSCKSDQRYQNRKMYTMRCMLGAGTHKLMCKDSYGDGWHGGHIMINGKKYCEDFTSGKMKMVDVIIP